MKKYFSLFLIAIFALVVVSCTEREDDVQDNDTYSVVYDLKNVNFANTTSGYVISRTFNNPLYDSDVLLIYRQDGTTNNGAPIWTQIPRTLYLTPGELDYDFDFSKYDFQIYAGGSFDLAAQPQSFKDLYLNGQTFRVVIVPASFGKNANVDFSDYHAVIKYFNIDESKVKSL